MKKYKGNMTTYEEIMKKYEGLIWVLGTRKFCGGRGSVPRTRLVIFVIILIKKYTIVKIFTIKNIRQF